MKATKVQFKLMLRKSNRIAVKPHKTYSILFYMKILN